MSTWRWAPRASRSTACGSWPWMSAMSASSAPAAPTSRRQARSASVFACCRCCPATSLCPAPACPMRASSRRHWAPARPTGPEAFKNERGLIEPDLVARALFAAAHQALDAVGSKALRNVALENVELVVPSGDSVTTVRVIDAQLAETDGDGLALSSTIDVGGRAIAVQASASRDTATQKIAALDLTASATDPKAAQPTGSRLGAVELKLSGKEGADAGQVEASVRIAGWSADLGARGIISGDLDFDGRLVTGTDRMEVGRLRASIGRSLLDFRGLIGPRPATELPGDAPAYRFNLVSARSTFAPDGSPEPAANAAVRLTGAYLPKSATLSADEIVLNGPARRGAGHGRVAICLGQGAGHVGCLQCHRHAGLAGQATVAMVLGARCADMGSEQRFRRPRHRRAVAVPGRAWPARQRRAAFRSRVLRHFQDRRHALRHRRPDTAGARCDGRGRLQGQRRRHRAVVGDGLSARVAAPLRQATASW